MIPSKRILGQAGQMLAQMVPMGRTAPLEAKNAMVLKLTLAHLDEVAYKNSDATMTSADWFDFATLHDDERAAPQLAEYVRTASLSLELTRAGWELDFDKWLGTRNDD